MTEKAYVWKNTFYSIMKNITHASLFILLLILASCGKTVVELTNAQPKYSAPEHKSHLISSIAFGSCGHETAPQPILQQAADTDPDLFIFLGDNIYGDTKVMDTLRRKYERLGDKPEFQALWKTSQVIATWDDHDFGWNDAGRHYEFKEESKDIFLDFWQVGEDDIRHSRKGIYTSYIYTAEGKTLQVILLDTRTFRDNLRRYEGQEVDTAAFFYGLDYWPHESPDSAFLGEEQWKWLEGQFQTPADLRIIGSSTQFGITWNSYEAWANFPHEQARMLDLIRNTKANGVLFLSGDVHYAEISQLDSPDLYPIYDITSSGITSTWKFATPNDNRIAGPVMENHFGRIDIDWKQEDPLISIWIMDVSKKERIKKEIRLSELQF